MTQQLQANTVCCGDPLPVSLQQQHRAWQQDSWNYDADSAVVSVFASPANCFAMPPRPLPSSQKKLHGVGCNSRGQLYHSHSPPESREDTKTMSRPLVVPVAIHCQQMEPLLAVCLFPGLSHSSLSWAYCVMQVGTLPTGCKAELCHYRQTYRPPSLLLLLYLWMIVWQMPSFAPFHTRTCPKTTVAYVCHLINIKWQTYATVVFGHVLHLGAVCVCVSISVLYK